MLSKDVINRLSEAWPNKNGSVARLVYRLYRYYAVWQMEKLQVENKPVTFLKPNYIYILASVGLTGSTNKELSTTAMVSKQAIGKLINELVNGNMLEFEKNDNDGRSNTIQLTDAGAELLMNIFDSNKALIEMFESRIGKEKTIQLLELMTELVDSFI